MQLAPRFYRKSPSGVSPCFLKSALSLAARKSFWHTRMRRSRRASRPASVLRQQNKQDKDERNDGEGRVSTWTAQAEDSKERKGKGGRRMDLRGS